MPRCTTSLVIGDTVVGEICHIRARRKNGPRYDLMLSAEDRDLPPNLILLCGTCHSLIDKNPKTFTSELLTEIKELHERFGGVEVTSESSRQAMVLLSKSRPKQSRQANITSISIGRDNHAPITVKQSNASNHKGKRHLANSIGTDATLSGYIDYLCDLYVKYMQPIEPDEGRAWGRIGKKIKDRFRLRKRSRNDLPIERFPDLVEYLYSKLAETPVGRKHLRRGTKLCCGFDEWRYE